MQGQGEEDWVGTFYFRCPLELNKHLTLQCEQETHYKGHFSSFLELGFNLTLEIDPVPTNLTLKINL